MARILVVDDDPTAHRVVAKLSEHEVSVVSGLSSAMLALSRGTVDLIICDVDMQGSYGLDLIGSIFDVRVMVVSDGCSLEKAVKAVHRGAGGWIERPFTGEQLRQAVGLALGEEGSTAVDYPLKGRLTRGHGHGPSRSDGSNAGQP